MENYFKPDDNKDLTFDQFVELVKQMRHNQRRFNNLKRPEINKTRMDLESQVDKFIAVKTSTQTKLF